MIRPRVDAVARTCDLAIDQPELASPYPNISGRNVNRFLHIAMSAEEVVAQHRMPRTLGQQTGCVQRCVGLDALVEVVEPIGRDIRAVTADVVGH